MIDYLCKHNFFSFEKKNKILVSDINFKEIEINEF